MSSSAAILALAEAVQKSAAEFRRSLSGWFLRDLAGSGDTWSPEVFDLYGFVPAEAAPPAEVVYRQLDSRDAKRVANEVNRAAKEHRCFDLQYNIQKQTGELRTLRNRGQMVSIGGNSFVIGIVSDVSGDERARTQFAEATAALQTAQSLPAREGLAPVTLAHSHRSGLSPRQIERVRQLMRENLSDRLRVEQMARVAGVSCAHFSRTFRIATGESPHRFLLNLRLAKAKESLLNLHKQGNLSLLAADLGFFDQAHLTKYFRKKYGQTPGQFLRSHPQVIEAVKAVDES